MTSSTTDLLLLRRSASDRFVRLVLASAGFATLAFFVLLMPGSGGWKAQMPQLAPWYAYPMLAVAFGAPILLGVLAWLVPRRVTNVLALITSVLFVLGMFLFPLALDASHLTKNAPPWFNGVHAIHGVIFATVARRYWLWVYAGLHGLAIASVRVWIHTNDVGHASVDGLSAVVFVLILMAITSSVLLAATQLDATAADARAKATLASASATREREETSINAMVHDDIMSVLLTASRPKPPAQLGDQAKAALSAIDRLERGESIAPTSAAEVVTVLEQTVARHIPSLVTEARLDADVVVPGDVVVALRDATAEAARNTMRHGGHQDDVRRLLVSSTEDSISVSLSDDGPGFDARKVAARRLGIQLSIVERMRMVNGGDARIVSSPGRGTTVELTWRAS